VAAAVVLALGGGAAGAGVMHAIEGSNTKTVTNSLSGPPISSTNNKPTGSVAQVASVIRPSVVSIQVSQGEGSGIVLSSDGLILTNNHVVESAASGGQIQVTFDDGKTAGADLVGRDPTSDLAVIKAKSVNNLKPAALGKSADINVGDEVVAIGSPLGLQGTVTSGIVSAMNRPVRTGDENGGSGSNANTAVLDAIQTDAAINPGNSGGPLVNMAGQVIGINSAIASTGGDQASGSQPGNIGVGFAIPIDEARPIAEQLEKNGKATHSQLGVQVQDSQGDTAGANLAAVTGGGAADQAGLKAGDIVTKVDDRRVDSADALIAAVRAHAPGSKVQVTYIRGGSEHTATVTLGTASS
jgi:putative serine protease PepD